MPPAEFLPLLLIWLLLFMIIVNQPSSARTLGNSTPSHHDHRHQNITFLMQNVLINVPPPSSQPATTQTQFTSTIPFSKPLGFFPPYRGIPLQPSIPTVPTGVSTQSLDFSDIGLSFPARASTLQELEFGSVKEIDEDLFESTTYGSLAVGKAHGIFVASSEYGSTSRMMALIATFSGNDFRDGLKFFGVHKTDLPESHIAVIGGTGKYSDANGYAVINSVAMGSEAAGKADRNTISFTVFLS